jgi:hypothetical protein
MKVEMVGIVIRCLCLMDHAFGPCYLTVGAVLKILCKQGEKIYFFFDK